MSRTQQVGRAGLRGWRQTVADAAATPVAKRSPFSEDQIRAAIGAVFLALSIIYVVSAVRDMLTD